MRARSSAVRVSTLAVLTLWGCGLCSARDAWLRRLKAGQGAISHPPPASAAGARPSGSRAPGRNARTPQGKLPLYLPARNDAVRFAVIGDSGTGGRVQYELADLMSEYRQEFPFDFVTMLGDNIYGGHGPADFQAKFEQPYKALLEAGVKFYASLGNHDDPNERYYKPFNMGGQRYYAYSKGNVRFFALDSNYMDPKQLEWLEEELKKSGEQWKICYFHHPLYSDGRFHGPDTDLRALLEPLFIKYGVSVVLSGHEHIYERLKPHDGIYYFVLGNAGQLRHHGIKRSEETVTGFDTDRSFMMVEVAGGQFYFQTVSRAGDTVDHGMLERPASTARAWAMP